MAQPTRPKAKSASAAKPLDERTAQSLDTAFERLLEKKPPNPNLTPEAQIVKKYLNHIEMFRQEGYSYPSIVQLLENNGAPKGLLDPSLLSETVARARSMKKRKQVRDAAKKERLAAAGGATKRKK